MTCDRKIGPFDCCSVVQGDCLELMKQLPDGCVDAVITDPPYGMNDKSERGTRTGRMAMPHAGKPTPRDWTRIAGDSEPFNPEPWLRFPIVVLFGAVHFSDKLPISRGWLIWDKREGGTSDDNADCDFAWTNLSRPARLYSQLWRGVVRAGEENGSSLQHPHRKPIALMRWCVAQTGNPETILDPYCGSGTTLVAAKKLGRHFLGFEISPEYCEIARKRIAAVEAQPTLFEPKPIQEELGL